MKDFEHCLKVKGGIDLVAPNPSVAQAYIKKAEESIQEIKRVETRDWKITIAYYSMYFSVYSILRRIGVKCEMHTCTISFMKEMLSEYFTKEDIQLLEMARKARVDEQYYTDRQITDAQYEAIINTAPDFVVKCKKIIPTSTEIEKIRKSILR